MASRARSLFRTIRQFRLDQLSVSLAEKTSNKTDPHQALEFSKHTMKATS